jgi:hypothetical protein
VGLKGNTPPAIKGGRIARDARLALEEKTGEKVISGQNFVGTGKVKKIGK